jgi:hypothetical protein
MPSFAGSVQLVAPEDAWKKYVRPLFLSTTACHPLSAEDGGGPDGGVAL